MLKKIKTKNFIKDAEKSEYIEENKEIKKPIFKPQIDIKENQEIKKQIFKPQINIKENQEIKRPIFKPLVEKKIIKPAKIIENKYKSMKEEDLKRKIIDIERRQRIKLLEDMRKQVRNTRK